MKLALRHISAFAFSVALAGLAGLASGCDNASQSTNGPAAASPAPAGGQTLPRATSRPPTNTPSPVSQNPEDKVTRVRAEEAMRLVKANEAIIIDVRGTDTYKQGHIKGAIDVPLERLERGEFKELPRDRRIIAYCT